ncbi:MAG: GDSL-type esterase/lipase family protein [Mariniblastus sp.]|nr:GDSL-type esterase/lipase family protein [Mariniblastus sp.]
MHRYRSNSVFLAVMAVIAGGLPGSMLAQEADPVPVFVLAGQSNMQGQAVVDMNHPEHYNGGRGTLNALLANPAHQDRMGHLRDADGNWVVREDVWIRYQTPEALKRGGLSIGFTGYGGQHHFGPELQFGHRVGDAFQQPVLLIKTAWGGKSLFKDFRPPSAGGEVGPYYQKMIREIRSGLQGYQQDFPDLEGRPVYLAGLVWQQGWNDMGDEEARAQYAQNLFHLIRDFRQEFNAPWLPVVIGELGNGGPTSREPMNQIRQAQASAARRAEFCGSVQFVPTAEFARPAEQSPNITHGHHWFGNAESYFLIGDSLGQAMLELVGKRPDKKRVLILGDSISIGYTPTVRKSLEEEAIVVRPMRNLKQAENCQGTRYGVEHIDRWMNLLGGEWDVIHFNFGLHDMKHVSPQTEENSNKKSDPPQSTPEQYRRQLTEIVQRLKQSEAQLIFATTTPVPDGVRPYRATTDPDRYNAIAMKIMQEHGVQVNDLYQFAQPRLAEIQRPANVHFFPPGSEVLGKQVADVIRSCWKAEPPKGAPPTGSR